VRTVGYAPAMAREVLLLSCELLLYGAGMLAVFRARHRVGLGVFLTAIGSLHFLETWLAANLYVQIAPGLVLSPGSVVLFSGKFFFILLLYIREDATFARQPIYGLLIGNLLAASLVLLLSQHVAVPASGDAPRDLHLLDQMGLLMIWGSVLLFVDCLLVILLYERLSRGSTWPIELRLWLAAVGVLVFDQAGFFAMLHFAYGVPLSVGYGGLLGKLVAATLYALMIGQYLRHFDRDAVRFGDAVPQPFGELFSALTYRQRYEALRQHARRDAITRLLNRGEFETLTREVLERITRERQSLNLLMFDIDHFKSINDLYGHQSGDRVLREVAAVLDESVRNTDHAFRFGGDEFAVLLVDRSHDDACAFADRLRGDIAALRIGESDIAVSVSIGVSTIVAGRSHGGIEELVRVADAMLYQAKADGRNRVSGEVLAEVLPP
jgi:diguanylate cyclase (GGDEF)-like protein